MPSDGLDDQSSVINRIRLREVVHQCEDLITFFASFCDDGLFAAVPGRHCSRRPEASSIVPRGLCLLPTAGPSLWGVPSAGDGREQSKGTRGYKGKVHSC